MIGALLISLLAFGAGPGAPGQEESNPPPPPKSEIWAGRVLLVGRRQVPFLGKVEARTETFLLTEVTKKGGAIHFKQTSCIINLTNAAGVKLYLDPTTPERLPPIELVFDRRKDGLWYQRPGTTGWKSEDVDGDGKPGMTVHVDAPLCGGDLYVGLESKTLSRGELLPGGGLKGQIKAEVKQSVLGTAGACLSIIANDSDEKARGTFIYVPVDAGATCASLAKEGWPKALTVAF